MNNANEVSSQKSPHYACIRNNSYLNTFYGHMLLEDFCGLFSCEFSRINESRKFFSIDSSDKQLGELLDYHNVDFLEYEFDKLLRNNMYSILVYGRAFTEIITTKDSAGKLLGIAFKSLNITKVKTRRGKKRFTAHQTNDKIVRFDIDNEWLVIHDIKALGFRRRHFTKLIKKMQSLDLPDYSLMDPNGNSHFDLERFNQIVEKRLLQLNRKTYWNGRKFDNQYLTESYMQYRIVKMKLLRLRFLNYLIAGYNKALERLGNEYGFSGRIIVNLKLPDYEKCLAGILSGELNTTEANKIIFHA